MLYCLRELSLCAWRQFLVFFDASGARSESTRTLGESEASGELTADQAWLLQMPALSSIQAQFPSAPFFGVPLPMAVAPMSLDNNGDNGEDASHQRPIGSGPMPWQYQVSARSPRPAQVTCGMSGRGSCSKLMFFVHQDI